MADFKNYGYPQSGGNTGQAPEFLNSFQNVSPEMLNFGISAGQDMLKKQRKKLNICNFCRLLKKFFLNSNR